MDVQILDLQQPVAGGCGIDGGFLCGLHNSAHGRGVRFIVPKMMKRAMRCAGYGLPVFLSRTAVDEAAATYS
jgi:hypothetical protein